MKIADILLTEDKKSNILIAACDSIGDSILTKSFEKLVLDYAESLSSKDGSFDFQDSRESLESFLKILEKASSRTRTMISRGIAMEEHSKQRSLL